MDSIREKKVLAALFKRRGGSGSYSMLFDELDSGDRQAITQRVKLEDNEEPVIINTPPDTDLWSLITTRRIIWFKESSLTFLWNTDVQDGTLALEYNAARGLKTKKVMRYLKIVTRDGEERILEVEPGAPLVAVWNVLKRIAQSEE